MVGDSGDGKAYPGGRPVSAATPEGEGTPVLGGVSEAELDVFVGKLRTDKNLHVPAASQGRERADVHGERLHKGVRRSLVSAALVETAAAESPAVEAPVAAPAVKHAWFVSLAGQPAGPFDAEALKAPWERGELGPDSLCWREGFQNWLPLSQVPELTQALVPLPQDLNAAVDLALSELAAAPDFAPRGAEGLLSLAAGETVVIPEAALPMATSLEAGATWAATKPVEPAGTHPVLSSPSPMEAVAERVEVRWRGGWWFTLAGGVAGGVTVALVLGLWGGWEGASALMGRMRASMSSQAARPVAEPPAPVQPEPVVVAPPAPPVTPPVEPPVVVSGGATDGAGTSAEGGVAQAALAGTSSTGAVGTATGAATDVRPALTGVAKVERGGALPVLSGAGTGLAVAAGSKASQARVEREVEAPPRALAATSRLGEVPLTSQARPVAPTPAPAPAPAKPKPATDDGDDLGLDEDYDRELSGPVGGATTREAPRAVYIPPVAPIRNPRETLTQSDVFEVVLANKGEVTRCADVKPRPVMEGERVVVRWSILPSGEVGEVVTETATLKGTAFARCIEGKVRSWVFPKHQEQGGPVRFPFVF
ncbi:GYF domain-containing protein [Myxococcus sp. K15C18031901]|uniref:GYF domain-containing protein n=1 Tax=Myxococcus dinghuensis TaxID=2906761 RepID=UPI0020A80446|nr:GYF domain-containing protein [Myxococcus dinghuensis]MCP3101836.1 GYF domain-containing protein [Myxococcus dinghuensis]